MEHEVNKYMEKQAELETLRAQMKEKYIAFMEQNAELQQAINKVEEEMAVLKIQITADAVEIYHKTHEKKLYGGIGIREMLRLVYQDSTALEWAKEHDMALELDTKAFEKIVRAAPENFEGIVTLSKEITVTFPTKR